jgi:hypothetical protein
MKKYFILALFSIAIMGTSCSDDETEVILQAGREQTAFDGITYLVAGFGSGVDITAPIAGENIKARVLNLELLYQDRGIELDNRSSKSKIYRYGKDYAEMNSNINQCLAGTLNHELPVMPFNHGLLMLSNRKIRECDIYEYGTCFLVNKQYALSVKSDFCAQLRDYVNEKAWEEINATNSVNRTDKVSIKNLFDKYGTHIATKAFYGAMWQTLLFREQLEWESTMDAQMEIGMNAKCPIPETGMTVSGNKDASSSTTDTECYKNSSKEEIERRIGGNVNIVDMNEWFSSCTTSEPSTCALLGYSLGFDTNGDSGLIPLYELLDDGDPRKEAIKEALNEYVLEKSIVLNKPDMVIIDAFGRHFGDGKAPAYLYEDYNGKKLKYYRIDEEISKHVKGVTKGKFHFYYSLGHLVDNAVVDMKFANSGDIDGDWKTRGNHANTGVSGDVKNRYLCIKTKNVKNGVPRSEFVTGFGVKVDGKVKSISKYTETSYTWKQNGDNWYKGLVHDDVYCIYTKDKLKEF